MSASIHSINTYFDIKHEGVLGKQQQKILAFLKDSEGEFTRRELANILGIDLCAMTARINEMMFIVAKEGKRRKCTISGRMCGTVRSKK
jgi:predicted HTH transcriptional regulator